MNFLNVFRVNECWKFILHIIWCKLSTHCSLFSIEKQKIAQKKTFSIKIYIKFNSNTYTNYMTCWKKLKNDFFFNSHFTMQCNAFKNLKFSGCYLIQCCSYIPNIYESIVTSYISTLFTTLKCINFCRVQVFSTVKYFTLSFLHVFQKHNSNSSKHIF
jgi:hypothetical protein